jgi:murein DD-endopeptidase MepM/ murein hydrolase activator NlpD
MLNGNEPLADKTRPGEVSAGHVGKDEHHHFVRQLAAPAGAQVFAAAVGRVQRHVAQGNHEWLMKM